MSVPAYQRAVEVLRQIATPLLDSAMQGKGGDWRDEAFDHWFTLRYISHLWEDQRSTNIDAATHEALMGALAFAHVRHHVEDLHGSLGDSRRLVAEAYVRGSVGCVDSENCLLSLHLEQLGILCLLDQVGNHHPVVRA